jgi:hypothetical protein
MAKSSSSTVLAALALLALSSAAGASQLEQQRLSVCAEEGRVLVTITVNNAGPEALYVPKALFLEDQLFGAAFSIVNTDSGAPLQYIGPMVKRGPLTPDDFLKVGPGKRHSNQIDITDSYDFLPGLHSYRLSYPKSHYLPGAALPDAHLYSAAVPVDVAPVTFSFTPR